MVNEAAIAAVLPREFGYVVVVVFLYVLFNIWMAVQVGRARKKYSPSLNLIHLSLSVHLSIYLVYLSLRV